MSDAYEGVKYLPLGITKKSGNKVAYIQARIQAQKQKYIDGCRKLGTVTGAMRYSGVKSYATISNWRNSDNHFLSQEVEALNTKTGEVIDIAESKLFLAIGYGAPWAVKYGLDRLSKKYKPKAEIDNMEPKRIEAIEIIVHEPRKQQIEDGSDASVSKEPGHTHPASC